MRYPDVIYAPPPPAEVCFLMVSVWKFAPGSTYRNV
jgi:hypothetical protein